jgi:hypothetical protein
MSDMKPSIKSKLGMFAQLPEAIQASVKLYLEANDFMSAKEIYDNWIGQSHQPNSVLDCAYTSLELPAEE